MVKDRIYSILGVIAFIAALIALTSGKADQGPAAILPSDGRPIVLFFYSRPSIMSRHAAEIMARVEEDFSDEVNFVKADVANPENKALRSRLRSGLPPEVYILTPDGGKIIFYRSGVVEYEELAHRIRTAVATTTLRAEPDPE